MKPPCHAVKFVYRQPICGVYFLLQNDDVVYVGKSIDIENRIKSHRSEGSKIFDDVVYIPLSLDALEAEELYWIECMTPRYNQVGNPERQPVRNTTLAAYTKKMLAAAECKTLKQLRHR